MEAKRQDIGMDIDENKKEETQKIQMAYTFIPFRFSNCV